MRALSANNDKIQLIDSVETINRLRNPIDRLRNNTQEKRN